MPKRGATVSAATRAKIAAGLREYYQKHPDLLDRFRFSRLGVKASSETCEKISAARTGTRMPFNPEKNAKISRALRGRKHSAEHRAKHAAAIACRPLMPSHRAKIVKSLIGNTRTRTPIPAETIAKIKDAYENGVRQVQLARKYGVSKNVIWRLLHSWKL
jgi:hypothetical protein